MKNTSSSQVVLFMTNKNSSLITQQYNKLKNETIEYAEVFLAFHQTVKEVPSEICELNHFAFTDAMLSALNYIPLDNNFLPVNSHFPLFQFYLNNPDYSYYWLVEDDVRFNGDWKCFFEVFSSCTQDFISSLFHSFQEDPNWFWWSTLYHPSLEISFSNRMRSFNPICRISNKALKYLHIALSNQWRGHHEVLIPTLLKYGGFSLLDFGGDNNYVLPGYKNKFYTEKTMRFRPVHTEIGNLKNTLYHPVKEI